MKSTVLGRILENPSGIAVCWVGNAGWLIRGAWRLVAFDPDLGSEEKVLPPVISAEELAPALDAVFITHEHGDHFNDHTCRVLAQQSKCLFVLPASCLEKGRRLAIPEARIRIARPREPFDLLGIRVEPLRALHGDRHQAVYRNANLDDCGYLLTLVAQTFLSATVAGKNACPTRTILQPGDSVLLQDHLALKDVDAMFVSPTDHNMHVGPASLLIKTLAPSHVFPQHFDTYVVTPDNEFWTHGYPDELKAALPPEMQKRYHKLRQGEVFGL